LLVGHDLLERCGRRTLGARGPDAPDCCMRPSDGGRLPPCETIRAIGRPGRILGNDCSPARSADRRSPVLSVVFRWSAAPARPRRSWQTPDAAPCGLPTSLTAAVRHLPGVFDRLRARRGPRRGSDGRASSSSPPVQRRPLPSISAGRRLVLVRRCASRMACVRAVGSQLGSQSAFHCRTPPLRWNADGLHSRRAETTQSDYGEQLGRSA
jgi:hypothetical protein